MPSSPGPQTSRRSGTPKSALTGKPKQSFSLPPHISRARYRETGALMGGTLALGILAAWGFSATHAADQTGEKTKKVTDHPPELIKEGLREVLPATKEATITVRLHVEVGGAVSEAQIEGPKPELKALEARALANAKLYKFKPAVRQGTPVDDWVNLPINFGPVPNVRTVTVKGSDTIGAALGPAWATALEAGNKDLHVEVEALGSSTGFAGLFDGSADLAASSRPIKPEEEELAKKLNIEVRSAVAGHDGIAVIVNSANPLQEMDLANVARIFSGKATRWSDFGAFDAPIRAIGRPNYSGTHAFFKDRVLSKLGPTTDFDKKVEEFEDSQGLVGRVVGDANAIGYVSLSYVISSVRALPLRTEPTARAVAPSADSVRDGSYPVSRPLMFYWRADASKDALEYVKFALSAEGQALVEKSGFVKLADGEKSADLEASLAASASADDASHKPETARVYFESASSTVTDEAKQALTKLASSLGQDKRVLVIGNTDNAGQAKANSSIARKRAEAVASQLRALGVQGDRISVTVADADRPLASNTTDEGRKENRRVDILVFHQ